MKEFLRVILRFTLAIISVILVIFLIVKMPSSIEGFSWWIYIVIFISISIVLLLCVSLLSNPKAKLKKRKKSFRKIHKIKVTQDFKDICKSLKQQYGRTLEMYRKRAIYIVIILVLSLVFTFIACACMAEMVSIVFLCIIMYCLKAYIKNRDLYNVEFRKVIIKEFVKLINPNLNYNYDGDINSYDYYIDASFDKEDYNTFETNDYISGYINEEILIEMCNISLLQCNDKEIVDVIDKALFSYTTCKNFIPNEIRIKKNSYNINKKNNVKLDDNEFEKYFDVFSDSEILTMQILTHDVMEQIVDFYLLYKIPFEIILKNNKVFIKYETGISFTPGILKDSTDVDLLWAYYNIINFAINVSTRINKLLNNIQI